MKFVLLWFKFLFSKRGKKVSLTVLRPKLSSAYSSTILHDRISIFKTFEISQNKILFDGPVLEWFCHVTSIGTSCKSTLIHWLISSYILISHVHVVIHFSKEPCSTVKSLSITKEIYTFIGPVSMQKLPNIFKNSKIYQLSIHMVKTPVLRLR